MKQKVLTLFEKLDSLDWTVKLLVRVSIGWMFFWSGWGKLNGLHEFTAYFVKLGIPAASIQAPFVAALELVGGAAVMLGLGTRVFGVMLAGTMAVAIITTKWATVLKGGSHAFYLAEWCLMLLLLWLAMGGAGKLSLDTLLKQKYAGEADSDEAPAETNDD